MKAILYFIGAVFLSQAAYAESLTTSQSLYLDYGSDFDHPLYQVNYKIIESVIQDDPEIFLFMCGRGMSMEMYQGWIKDFVRLESQRNPKGVVVYIMNFPGQIVLRKEHLRHLHLKGWKRLAVKAEEEFVRRYRGTIKSYDEYSLATNAMVNLIYMRHKKPIAIVGHSMGGHVALRYALHLDQALVLKQETHASRSLRAAQVNSMALELSRTLLAKHRIQVATDLIKGIALVSPMFDVNTGRVNNTLARMLATAATFVGLGGAYVPGAADYDPQRDSFGGDKQTTCEAGYAELKRLREKYGLPMVTYGWLKATFDSIAYLENADFASFNTPVLAILADEEHVVLNEGTQQILSRIRLAHVQSLQGMHTPFVERPEIRNELISRIAAFFDKLPAHEPR